MIVRRRIFELAFSVVAVVALWNLQLATLFGHAADKLGFADPSVARTVVVDGGVPVFVVIATAGLVVAYETLIWPRWRGSDYCGGLWLYCLVARTDTDDFAVAGWFRLEHAPGALRVRHARAFYLLDDGALEYRGDWWTHSAWLEDGNLWLMFEMRADDATKEPLPSQYRGLIHLSAPETRRGLDGATWAGSFQDLGDRRAVHGPVTALRMKRSVPSSAREEALREDAKRLRAETLRRLGRRVARAVGDEAVAE